LTISLLSQRGVRGVGEDRGVGDGCQTVEGGDDSVLEEGPILKDKLLKLLLQR
jgi:hypothetical protein